MNWWRTGVAEWEPLNDFVLASVLIAAFEIQCWFLSGPSSAHHSVTAIAGALFLAPLALRQRFPGPAVTTSLFVALVQALLGGALLSSPLNSNAPTAFLGVVPVLALFLLSYSTGARLDRQRSLIVLSAAIILVMLCTFLPSNAPSGLSNVVQSIFYSTLTVLPGWYVGRLVRARSRRGAAFRELSVQVTADIATREAIAIGQERARIGDELQDIIAHSVSAMVIQAGGARLQLLNDPGKARLSILTIEQTGRETLSDLRRLLGVLRKDDDPHALRPQPGLSELGTLLEIARRDGIDCHIERRGEETELTPGVDLVAYRFVELSLETAARFRARRCDVVIEYLSHALELEVRVDRNIKDAEQLFRPLVERVALYDGRVRWMEDRGHFRITARLPLLRRIAL